MSAELDREIERYEKLIKYELSKHSKEHLDIAEKCSYVDICNAILKQVGIEDTDTFVNDCASSEETPLADGSGTYRELDFDLLTQRVWETVCRDISPRHALIAILYGLRDSINMKTTLEQVMRYMATQDRLIDIAEAESEECNGKDTDR